MAAPMSLCGRCLAARKCLLSRGLHVGSKAEDAVAQTKNKVISIPKKIVRDDTAILRALASTVKKDYGSPPYRYVDDPFLIPRSHLEKRTFSLAKASGIKAAQYVIKNFPKYFEIEYADPRIEAYMPKSQLKLAEDTEDGLKERIGKKMVLEAFQSYQRCRENGVSMSQETKERLLALLCLYNSDTRPADITPDEAFLWRDVGQDNSKKIINTWNKAGPAEEVFENMEEKSSEAYNSMIRGCAKYYNVDRAYALFKEMQEKGLKPPLEAFNAIFSISSFLGDRFNERWQTQQDILKNMQSLGIQPDISTFTELMYALSRSSKGPGARHYAMMSLNEMKSLNIEPNLATWNYVLRIYYANKDNENPSNILFSIINELKDKEFSFTHPDDYEFFSSAMVLASQCLRDLELGYKIDALLNHGNNVAFIGDAYRESVYFTNFIKLICTFEQIDTIMEHYDRITPHAYTPTQKAVEELLLAIELNDGYHYVPKIYSDLVAFDYGRNRNFVGQVLATVAKKPQEEQLQKQLMKIADSVIEQMKADAENTRLVQPFTLNGVVFGDIILIYLHGKDFAKAWSIFQLYQKNKLKIEQFPSEKALVDLTQQCIELNDVEKTMVCIRTLGDFAYPQVDDMIVKAKKSLQLTKEQEEELDDL